MLLHSRPSSTRTSHCDPPALCFPAHYSPPAHGNQAWLSEQPAHRLLSKSCPGSGYITSIHFQSCNPHPSGNHFSLSHGAGVYLIPQGTRPRHPNHAGCQLLCKPPAWEIRCQITPASVKNQTLRGKLQHLFLAPTLLQAALKTCFTFLTNCWPF